MQGGADFGFYEFFAGGGMARLGLGARWACLMANDFDAKKAECYRANFGGDHLIEGDVWDLQAEDLPGAAHLAWASFPCQDLSLAGRRAGIQAERSGAFFGFWRLMQALKAAGRAPRLIVIENVTGLLTSHGGADFAALCAALAEGGYRYGALQIDAVHFLPQSRPRLFVVAVRDDLAVAPGLTADQDDLSIPCLFHTGPVRAAQARLPETLKARWLWWRLPPPPMRNADLIDFLETDPPDAPWHTAAETGRLLSLMAGRHRDRVEAARREGGPRSGTIFRRTRTVDGAPTQRAEARFDGLAGCLRTPGGGSSRQFLILVDGESTRTRQLSARECARLMGLPEDYILPAASTAALKVTGDGVAVPAVRWLAGHLLEPLLDAAAAQARAA